MSKSAKTFIMGMSGVSIFIAILKLAAFMLGHYDLTNRSSITEFTMLVATFNWYLGISMGGVFSILIDKLITD